MATHNEGHDIDRIDIYIAKELIISNSAKNF